jgi:hypothetical protein
MLDHAYHMALPEGEGAGYRQRAHGGALLHPREDGLTRPADTSISSLADALGLLSRWRLGLGKGVNAPCP